MRNRLKMLHNWWSSRLRSSCSPLTELQQAQALIAAIDAGGLPLNPLRVNTIARNLGLEVSRNAPVEKTIQRIRAAIQRA